MAKRGTKRRAGSRFRSSSRRSQRPGSQRLSRAAKNAVKNAVTLIVQLRPREGQDLLLEAELRALLGPTRKEQGCLVYDLYRAAEPPKAFLLHEVWASREDHLRHTKTDHFLRWNARKDALLASLDRAFWTRLA